MNVIWFKFKKLTEFKFQQLSRRGPSGSILNTIKRNLLSQKKRIKNHFDNKYARIIDPRGLTLIIFFRVSWFVFILGKLSKNNILLPKLYQAPEWICKLFFESRQILLNSGQLHWARQFVLRNLFLRLMRLKSFVVKPFNYWVLVLIICLNLMLI